MRAIVPALAALVLAGLLASGCGGESTATPESGTAPVESGSTEAASGAELFSANCESCHGAEGAGGHVGPDLQKSAVAENLSQVKSQVENGSGAMPPFSGVLSAEQIDVIAQYVVEEIAPKQ